MAQESDIVAFLPLDVDALAPGHTLVVPRAHYVGVLDTPADMLGTTMDLVQRVGRAMTEELGATGIVVLNASGPFSGQTVGHLHFHVVPCWPDDEGDVLADGAFRSAGRRSGALQIGRGSRPSGASVVVAPVY